MLNIYILPYNLLCWITVFTNYVTLVKYWTVLLNFKDILVGTSETKLNEAELQSLKGVHQSHLKQVSSGWAASRSCWAPPPGESVSLETQHWALNNHREKQPWSPPAAASAKPIKEHREFMLKNFLQNMSKNIVLPWYLVHTKNTSSMVLLCVLVSYTAWPCRRSYMCL